LKFLVLLAAAVAVVVPNIFQLLPHLVAVAVVLALKLTALLMSVL
jgi:hypothetical protein